MVQQIIEKGLRLNFPANGVVEEVEQNDVLCCNPLSVASNKKGKKRLCLDLSCHVNLACKAQKLRIESVQDFVKVVNKGDWAIFYDLKSAFHHISVVKKHRKYLGFCVVVDGREKFYRFSQMPFVYKDASRILTKVMRTPIVKLRSSGLGHISTSIMGST